MRTYLLQYLKGSKEQKETLKREQREYYDYFDMIWNLRNQHMVKDIPLQYLFFLKCCFQPNCCHPVCKSPVALPCWYEGGPRVSYLPLPIPDPDKPWGRTDCSECTGRCSGHYMKPLQAIESPLQPMSKPPSAILKEAFQNLKGKSPSSDFFEDCAKKTLLPPHEVEMWIQHLATIAENRKRGALKAAETRRQKAEMRSKTVYFCGVCHDQYLDFTDEQELWIACDSCDIWFHFVCVGLQSEPEKFFCDNCRE